MAGEVEIVLTTDRGRHSDAYTQEVAEAFAEAVRVLNHATGVCADTAVTEPAVLYGVVAALNAAAFRMAQTTSQIAAGMRRQLDDGTWVPVGELTAEQLRNRIVSSCYDAGLTAKRLARILAELQSDVGDVASNND